MADARAWLARQPDSLAAPPLAGEWQAGAAGAGYDGVLGMRLNEGHEIFLFRRESISEVRWAGEPVKHLARTDDGVRLAPRRSFNVWRETVHGQSRPWSQEDIEDADSTTMLLRQALQRMS